MMHLNHLPNQKQDERVALFLRAHWFAVLKIVLVLLLLILAPSAIIWLAWDAVALWVAHPFLGPLLAVGASVYLLAVWLFAFRTWVDYYLDTWIVTNERIINIVQKNLFHRVASELHLGSIQDVTSELKGFLQSVLNFGDVHIQTAGEQKRFEFDNVADPDGIKHTILRLVEEDKRRHGSIASSPR